MSEEVFSVLAVSSGGSNVLLAGNPRKDSFQPATCCRLPPMLVSSRYSLVFWQLKKESVFFLVRSTDFLIYILEVTVLSRKPCAVPPLPLETGLGVSNEHH